MIEIEQSKQGTFSPEATESLRRAYAAALDLLGQDGASEEQKTALAKYLMEIARGGEMDERKLCSLAILHVRASHLPEPPAKS